MTFLALLELIRIGEIIVAQSSTFGEIRVKAALPDPDRTAS